MNDSELTFDFHLECPTILYLLQHISFAECKQKVMIVYISVLAVNDAKYILCN